MKKSKKKWLLYHRLVSIAILAIIGSPIILMSQTTNPMNSGGSGYLGWDNTVNTNLEIRHDTPGQPIRFGTNGFERMRIHSDGRISINTILSQNSRVNIQQNVTGGIGVRADIIGITNEPVYQGLYSFMSDRNVGIFTECIGFSKQEDVALFGTAKFAGTNIGIWDAPMVLAL